MALLPVEQQILNLNSMLQAQNKAPQYGLGDFLSQAAQGMALGDARGLGFGSTLGMAGANVLSGMRGIENQARQLNRENINDQLNMAKFQAQLEQQKRAEALQREQMGISYANLDLARQKMMADLHGSMIPTYQQAHGQQPTTQNDGSVLPTPLNTPQESPIMPLSPQGGGVTRDGKRYAYDETGRPLLGIDPVEGYAVKTGAAPTGKQADDLTKLMKSQKALEPLLARYKTLASKYGSEKGGAAGSEMKQISTMISMHLKNIDELGALAGPDMDLLSSQFYDPTSWGANTRGMLFNGGFGASPKDLALQSAKNLQDKISGNVNSAAETYGYKRAGSGKHDPLGLR